MSRNPRVHVLFLNTQDGLRADVSVHVSLARAFDRRQVRVSVATSTYETPGDSARAAFEFIADTSTLPLDLGRPIASRRGWRKLSAALHNLRGLVSLARLAIWSRRNRVDLIHTTERPRDMLFGLLLARLTGCAYLVHAHTTF